jgi:hypothetical protein
MATIDSELTDMLRMEISDAERQLIIIEKANARLDEAILKIDNKIIQNNKDKSFIVKSKEINNFKLQNLNKQITMKHQLLDAFVCPAKKKRSNIIFIFFDFYLFTCFYVFC